MFTHANSLKIFKKNVYKTSVQKTLICILEVAKVHNLWHLQYLVQITKTFFRMVKMEKS